jgi:hypothetical protein
MHIILADPVVAQEVLASSLHDDASVLDHVGVLGQLQRRRYVLLDEEDGESLVPVEQLDGHEQLLDHQGPRAPAMVHPA